MSNTAQSTALFIADRLPSVTLAEMQADFDSLKPSQYKDGSYRLRRYSTFSYDRSSQSLTLNPHSQFIQSSELNSFQGNVARDYDDLSTSLIGSAGFRQLMHAFATHGDLPDHSVIEVHQMRIRCQNGVETITTPEGIHQDGFDRIGMFNINRHHVDGGKIHVYHDCDSATLHTTLDCDTGSYCVMDDAKFWHYATPITGSIAGETGFWDLFVLTATINDTDGSHTHSSHTDQPVKDSAQ